MPTTLDCLLLRDLFGTAAMREVFDSRAMVQGWLDVEAALARAQARVGVIPADAAEQIAAVCDAGRFDLDALRRGIAESQHPLVPAIRALVEEAGEAGHWVHWGATTQDIIDTGAVLQLRRAFALLMADLDRALQAAAALAEAHAATPMAGRTHGQHAVPVTFGLKVASWIDELLHARGRLAEVRAALPASLAGGAGTLASLGDKADEVLAAFARELELPQPPVPWHAARYGVREVAYALRQLAAAGERIAAEVVRLQATEVGELREPAMPGHVGSSTMPQKRNPMTSEYLIGSARMLRATLSAIDDAPAHASERDMAPWAAEWIALPQGCILAASVVDKLAGVLEGLHVDARRMRANLDLTDGAIMAEAVMMRLGEAIGHEEAHHVLWQAARQAAEQGIGLGQALENVEGAQAVDVHELLDPAGYLGWSEPLALAAARRARAAAAR